MSYRCHVCTAKVPHGQPLRRHVVKRPNGNIATEIPVCASCAHSLANGEDLPALITHYRLHPVEEQSPPKRATKPGKGRDREREHAVTVAAVKTGKGTTHYEVSSPKPAPPAPPKKRRAVQLFGEEV